jgi:hypothetical protein
LRKNTIADIVEYVQGFDIGEKFHILAPLLHSVPHPTLELV